MFSERNALILLLSIDKALQDKLYLEKNCPMSTEIVLLIICGICNNRTLLPKEILLQLYSLHSLKDLDKNKISKQYIIDNRENVDSVVSTFDSLVKVDIFETLSFDKLNTYRLFLYVIFLCFIKKIESYDDYKFTTIEEIHNRIKKAKFIRMKSARRFNKLLSQFTTLYRYK